MLIQLSDGCWVAPERVEEVSVEEHGVVVRMMDDGPRHHVGNDYGKSSYATAKRLVAEINAARREA